MKILLPAFSVKHKENDLQRKYRTLAGSAKNLSPLLFLQMEQIDNFIVFSTTQQHKKYLHGFSYFGKIKFWEFILRFALCFYTNILM